MGDDRLDIEPGLEEPGQTIPGFKEPAACHAIHADAFEDNFVRQIEGYGAGGNAEERHAASVFHGVKGLVQRGRVAGHFERGIDSFTGCDLSNGSGDLFRGFGLGIEHMIDPDLFGEV